MLLQKSSVATMFCSSFNFSSQLGFLSFFNQSPLKALFLINYSDYALFVFVFLLLIITIFIIVIMVSRFDCHLVGGLKQSDMQDFRYHTLWSV